MKASKLLKKARQWIMDEGGVVCPHKFGGCNHDNENCPVFCIDQALKEKGCPDPDGCDAVKKNADLCNDLDARDATIAELEAEIKTLKNLLSEVLCEVAVSCALKYEIKEAVKGGVE